MTKKSDKAKQAEQPITEAESLPPEGDDGPDTVRPPAADDAEPGATEDPEAEPAPEEPGDPSPEPADPDEPTEGAQSPAPALNVEVTEEHRLRILRAPTEALEKALPTLAGELRELVASELGRRRDPDPIRVMVVTKGGFRVTMDGYRTEVKTGSVFPFDESERDAMERDGLELRKGKGKIVEDSTGRLVLREV